MNEHQRFTALGNPFFLWSQLAWKTGVMMLESAEVIGHRSARMAVAGLSPSARDRREFTRMSEEKVEAGFESAHAMAAHVASAHARLGMRTFEQFAAAASALASLAGSRTAHEAFARQSALFRSLANPAVTASQLPEAVARLVSIGLAPIHARASANAKRLRRGKMGA